MSPSRLPLFFLALFVGLLSPAATTAQDPARVAIQGAVIDARSGLPIQGVEVTLADLGLVTRTDSAGAFFLPNLALGTYPWPSGRMGTKWLKGLSKYSGPEAW